MRSKIYIFFKFERREGKSKQKKVSVGFWGVGFPLPMPGRGLLMGKKGKSFSTFLA